MNLFGDLVVPNNHFPNINPFQQIQEYPNSITVQNRDESTDSFKTDDRSSKGTKFHSFAKADKRLCFFSELSIEEYLPKSQPIPSPVPSMNPVITSSPANPRLSSSSAVVVNTSSPIDDCGQ